MKGLWEFVDHYVFAVRTHITVVIVKIEPGIDICFHDHFSCKIEMSKSIIHEIIGALIQGYKRIRQILIHFTLDIRNIFLTVISVWSDQNSIIYACRVATTTCKLTGINELHIHGYFTDLKIFTAMRTAN